MSTDIELTGEDLEQVIRMANPMPVVSREEKDRAIRAARILWRGGPISDHAFARWCDWLVRHGVSAVDFLNYADRQRLRSIVEFWFAVSGTSLVARGVSWLVIYFGIY